MIRTESFAKRIENSIKSEREIQVCSENGKYRRFPFFGRLREESKEESNG